MKILNLLCVSILLIFSLTGCAYDDPKYIHFEKKPSNNAYTTEIAENLSLKTPYSIELFNTDLYKTFPLTDEEKKILINFIKSTTIDNFNDYEKISLVEVYQLRITFDNGDKYIIKVYNDNLISVNPYDGIFNEDIINMNNIPIHYNLYDFCIYTEKTHTKENSL